MPELSEIEDQDALLNGNDIPVNEEVEEPSDAIAEEYYPVEYSISSYGADYPVDGLVKRVNAGSIYIPKFQRGYVWNIYRASRFVESLLLGLPVPAIFLSKETDTNKLLVIDGQQRLRTLQYYYNGVFQPTERGFKLKGVNRRFLDCTYDTLPEDDRIRLDDSIVHAIIVKQEDPTEESKSSGPSSIYHIFERLNTGGVLLQPQEIRTCIYHGPFIELLEDLNKDSNWRALFGKVSSRMRDRELILRFLSLYFASDAYTKPMKEFLNRFTFQNRNLGIEDSKKYSSICVLTTEAIKKHIGERAFKLTRAVNAAVCDAVMVGIANRLSKGPILQPEQLKSRYTTLMETPGFVQAISSGTTDEQSVRDRMRLGKLSFGDVP